MQYFGVGVVVILYWTLTVIPYMDYINKYRTENKKKDKDKKG